MRPATERAGPAAPDDVRAVVAAVLELPVDHVDEHTDLVELGMDSMTMMRLVGHWRQMGSGVGFSDLVEAPTVAAWRELIARRGELGSSPEGDGGPGDPVDESAPFTLTTMQHAYWVGRAPGQRLGGVAAHFSYEFDGVDVDPERLERAVRALIARHGMLRVRIGDDGRQQIPDHDPWPGLDVHDLRGLTAGEADIALADLRRRLSTQELDVRSGRVLDVALSLLPDALRPGGTRLHLDLDMIPADALSVQTLFSELAHLHTSPGTPLPDLGYGFARYCADRVAAEKTEGRLRYEADREYWRERLPDLPPAPALPVRAEGEDATPTQVVRRSHWLAPQTARRLEHLSREHRLTPAMTMAAAVAETLSAWSADPDLLLNLPLFDREPLHPDVDAVVGDFTSSVLVSWTGSRPGSFAERARRLQDRFRADAAHARYSGVEVLRDASRLLGEPVLAPVVYTSALGFGDLFSPGLRSSLGEPVWVASQGPQIHLDVQVSEFDGGILLNADAREAAFEPGAVDAMFSALRGLVTWLDEGRWDEPAPDLLPDEQRQVRVAVNATGTPTGTAGTLHAGFFRRAREAPEREALLWGDDGAMGYGELADRALRVAGAVSARGVARGEPVVVSLPRGADQVVAVLGVLAAGGAYLPIGPDQPAARRARMQQLAGARLVLTDAADADGWNAAEVLTVDGATAGTPVPAPVAVDPDELAYVIFTSGSTGEPKGVEITHRAAVNTVEDIGRRFGVGDTDRVLAVSALEFDLSVYDVFGLLSAGGAVVFVEDTARRDARRWAELVARHGVTVWNSVPVLLEMFLTVVEGGDTPPPPLRLAMASGDWVGLDLPARVAAVASRCRFVAMGGATEAAIWSNFTEVARVDPDWTSIPYGRPLANQCFRVVDGAGRDRPDLVPGELWIGGAGVARGYRGAPELTARQFVTDRGQRWYRTGDIGRYLPDGTLEFLGRADQQVKIRGHRVELGEIEAVLAGHPTVGRAVASVTDDRRLVAAVLDATPPRTPEPRAPSSVGPAAGDPSNVSGDTSGQVVDTVLVRALGLDTLLDGRSEPVDPLGDGWIAEAHRPVVGLWLRYLLQREVLTGDAEAVTSGPRLPAAPRPAERRGTGADGDRGDAVHDRLLARIDDYRRILAGDLDPAVLLDDELLAPAALADRDPDGRAALASVAREIAALSAALGRPVEIVELDGRAGLTAARLLEALTPDQVRYTLLDRSTGMLADAAARLDLFPHETGTHLLPVPRVPSELRHRFDVVLASGALHRCPDPGQGPALARLLVRPGGRLFAIEQGELGPLALVTAALLDHGYRDLDAERRAAGSPTLPADRWTTLLEHAGWTDVAHHAPGRSPTVLLRACRPADARDVDAAELREHASGLLPEHMLPERVEVVAWLPLGHNGKLDRTALRAVLGTARPAEPTEPPQGDLECSVAAVWADLLRVPEVGRHQNFFALGGDSLLATRLVESLAQRLGTTVSLRRFFTEPTVRAVAAEIGSTALEVDEGVL